MMMMFVQNSVEMSVLLLACCGSVSGKPGVLCVKASVDRYDLPSVFVQHRINVTSL